VKIRLKYERGDEYEIDYCFETDTLSYRLPFRALVGAANDPVEHQLSLFTGAPVERSGGVQRVSAWQSRKATLVDGDAHKQLDFLEQVGAAISSPESKPSQENNPYLLHQALNLWRLALAIPEKKHKKNELLRLLPR